MFRTGGDGPRRVGAGLRTAVRIAGNASDNPRVVLRNTRRGVGNPREGVGTSREARAGSRKVRRDLRT